MNRRGPTYSWPRGLVLLAAVAWICVGAGSVRGADEKQLKNTKLSMGVGAGYVRFDTNFKFTEKDSGLSAFVDAEGTLGLPESDTVGIVYGRYRFSKKHALGFSAFRIKRENSLFADQLNLGDWTITGEAKLTDDTDFYYLNYTYTILQDERSRVFAAFGLYGLNLSYRLDLFGEISYQGEPLADETYEAVASAFAPLPMFGLDAIFALTKRWWLGTKITLVGGSYRDITAGVLDTSVRSGYEFSKHVGVIIGIEYFNAGVTIDDEDVKTEVAYGYDGLFIGLALHF